MFLPIEKVAEITDCQKSCEHDLRNSRVIAVRILTMQQILVAKLNYANSINKVFVKKVFSVLYYMESIHVKLSIRENAPKIHVSFHICLSTVLHSQYSTRLVSGFPECNKVISYQWFVYDN